METTQVISFISASVVLALMPGPDNIFVLTESLISGKRNGLFISIGLCLGVIIHTTAAATGLSLILSQSALVFNIIKYAGALYLFYLAYMATKDQPQGSQVHGKSSSLQSSWQLIKKGFLMNVLNPKVSLFFIAFLPQFIVADGMPAIAQMIVLGILFMLSSLAVFTAITFLANTLTPYLNSHRFWKVTKTCKVITFCLLGVLLSISSK